MIPRLAIDEQRLRALWATDATTGEIARAIGCSDSLVSKRAIQLGLPRRALSTATLPQRDIVIAYRQGASMGRIVEALRPRFPTLAVTTVRRILLQRGVKLRPRIAPMDRIAECVRLSRLGLEATDIGRRLGMSDQQVQKRLGRAGMRTGRGRRPRVPVRAIVSRALAGETYGAIAASFGCTASAVGIHVRKHRAARLVAAGAVA